MFDVRFGGVSLGCGRTWSADTVEGGVKSETSAHPWRDLSVLVSGIEHEFSFDYGYLG